MNKQYLKESLEYLLDYNSYLTAGLWEIESTRKVGRVIIRPVDELRVVLAWWLEKGLVILPLSEGRVELRIRKDHINPFIVNKEHNISNYFEDPYEITEGEVELFSTIEGDEIPFLLYVYEWLLRINNPQKVDSQTDYYA